MSEPIFDVATPPTGAMPSPGELPLREAPDGSAPVPIVRNRIRLLGVAEAMYRERRLRAKLLPEAANVLEEPGWDILLDLYVAQLQGRRVSVTSACLAACVPVSTALRYVGLLEECGLVCRRPDERDGRRSHLVLTNRGVEAMSVFLERSGLASASSS
jgi:DNA-binding MarR family transcriptional regulator